MKLKLFVCGDVMPGGVLPYQKDCVSPRLAAFLRGFDCRIGTLEAAIGTAEYPYDPVKMAGRCNIVYARDTDLARICELGFDVVSLANNHVMDLGPEGLRNTLQQLDARGILHCGAGMDAREAARPVIWEKEGLRVAIFAYCMHDGPYLGHVVTAGGKTPGVNPLILDRAVQEIREAKKQYDRVVVLPHWGQEYRYTPVWRCVELACALIRSGADAVLGSHTHRIQPVVWHHRRPVCFSMGNFLFPDFFLQPPRPIWYPGPDVDLETIPDVVGYPYPVDSPVRSVWPAASRYGRVACLELHSSIFRMSWQHVHASRDNILDLCSLPPKMRKQLHKLSLKLKLLMIRHWL